MRLADQHRRRHALAQLLDGDTGVVPLELGQRRGGLLHLAGLSVEGGQHAVGPGDARAGAQALLHQRARLAILVALTVRGGHAKVDVEGEGVVGAERQGALEATEGIVRLAEHGLPPARAHPGPGVRSEEHTSELQSLMRISYAVFCLKKKKKTINNTKTMYQ